MRRVWASPSIPMPAAATGAGSVHRATVRPVSRGPSVPVATVATQPSSGRVARVSPRGADPVRAGFSGGRSGRCASTGGVWPGRGDLEFRPFVGYNQPSCRIPSKVALPPASAKGPAGSGVFAGRRPQPVRRYGGRVAFTAATGWRVHGAGGCSVMAGLHFVVRNGLASPFFFIRGGRSNSGCSCVHRHARAAVWKIGRAGAAG